MPRLTKADAEAIGKDAGHGWICRQLYVTLQQARDLADCPMSLDAWVALMEDKGVIAAND